MKEYGGENEVMLSANDSDMGMAHGGKGEHQVKECDGEDRVISIADDFGMGTAHGKEGVSMKKVVIATLERAREHYKERALWVQMLPL